MANKIKRKIEDLPMMVKSYLYNNSHLAKTDKSKLQPIKKKESNLVPIKNVNDGLVRIKDKNPSKAQPTNSKIQVTQVDSNRAYLKDDKGNTYQIYKNSKMKDNKWGVEQINDGYATVKYSNGDYDDIKLSTLHNIKKK